MKAAFTICTAGEMASPSPDFRFWPGATFRDHRLLWCTILLSLQLC